MRPRDFATPLTVGLVLGGAVAAGQRQRVRDAVVLKTVGATRSQIRAAWLVEYALVGLVAGGRPIGGPEAVGGLGRA